MKYNITLVCNPSLKNLTHQSVAIIIDGLEKSGARIINDEILDEDIAHQIVAENITITNELKAILDKAQIDIIVEEHGDLQKDLIVCDMESTIINNEFLDNIAEEFNIKEQVEKITANAMNGEISFNESLFQRIELVKGINKKRLEEIYYDKVIYNQGALNLVEKMRELGKHAILVSGGFTLFTNLLLKEMPFNKDYANVLEFDKNNNLTGAIPPVLNGEAKETIMLKYCQEHEIDIKKTIAIGDGSNDLFMLKRAGLGLAYKAKPTVKTEISNQINYSDFTTVLYVQGIKS